MATTVPAVLHSSTVITRYPANPVLSNKDVPYDATLIFNAGVCKYQGRYVTVFRNDWFASTDPRSDHHTNLGLAFSNDGVKWQVEPEPCITLEQAQKLGEPFCGGRDPKNEIKRFYDPRLTVIEGRVCMCFAVDTAHGLRGGIAVTEDFRTWDIRHMSFPDNRNMVLFPEKIGGQYVRLERPMPVYSRGGKDRFDTWIGRSPDLRYWGDHELVLGVEDVPFANDKTGPAAPPIKTPRGWLATFHAVDRDETRGKNGWEAAWKKRYTAGLMLLDLKNPALVLGYTRTPLIAPEAPYEVQGGFRNNVIFPGGMILEDDGEVKIYYGAADTVECLATAHVDDLIALCV